MKLKMKQIVIAPWSSNGHSSYSLFGLSTAGNVYRYDPPCEGWLPNGMEEATCIEEHKKRKSKKVIAETTTKKIRWVA